MTELDFLIELLLNHKLQKATKDSIQARIKEIQASRTVASPRTAVLSPSVQKQAEFDAAKVPAHMQPDPPEEPLAQPSYVAQQAMADRARAIQEAQSGGAFGGKVAPGQTSPRKFRAKL